MLRRATHSPCFCMVVCKYFPAMLEQTKIVFNDVCLIAPGLIQLSRSWASGRTRS
jgi:hypothetical protein